MDAYGSYRFTNGSTYIYIDLIDVIDLIDLIAF